MHGKKYRNAADLVDHARFYEPAEAVGLVKQTSTSNFDGTVELHMRLGVDPRHSEQMVRGVAVLPAGTGKKVRVLVFAQGEAAKDAEEAGADFIGGEDLIKRIEGGWLDFDVVLATPDMMSIVSKVARILGPRHLMPSPRTETVTADIKRGLDGIRKGRVQFVVDKAGIIHAPIGKVSFDDSQLLNNLATMVDAVTRAKPQAAKGQYVRSITLSPTMGPSVRVDIATALELQPATS